MYAIVRTGGKQYKVKPGDKFTVEKLAGEKGATIDLEEVLLIADEKSKPKIGAPVVEGAKVSCEFVAQAKAKKVIVFKFKRRKRYMRKRGHRQELTMLRVNSITCGTKVWKTEKTADAEAAPKTAKAATTKKAAPKTAKAATTKKAATTTKTAAKTKKVEKTEDNK